MTPRHLVPRPRMVMLPSGVTLASLFFGIFAIVAASRGDYERAVLYVLIGAVCDALDGRVARATGTGSRFGAELDSLVDAITFGLAPAMIMYFAVLHKNGWDWLFVFGFTACAVVRLARFNVEQAGRPKTYFHGLPSPAAGGVLATYYWFSQTTLYTETLIAALPWHQLLRYLMAGLAFLMVSDVPYPALPTFSVRTVRGVIGLLLVVGLALGLIFLPREFFFPVGMLYVVYGIVAAAVHGLLERTPLQTTPATPDGAVAYLPDDEGDSGDDAGNDDFGFSPHRRRRGHRGRRGRKPAPDHPQSQGPSE
ncbi:MAG: CDP-diacylglycerol--serine O-phosphatidyltransferase [Gemmatimonadaceae bacterium]|nr:CDP-diacylglycerol--serine O-phosphatidyltransferase [Gemmatimonadaceae bacterium]